MRNKKKISIVVYLLLLVCNVNGQEIKKLDRYDLNAKIFDMDLYRNNFVFVDIKYVDDKTTKILRNVAYYNTVMKNIDTNYLIKLKFSFCKSGLIKNISFIYLRNKYKIEDVNISRTAKNGLNIYAIRVKTFGEYKEYLSARYYYKGKIIGYQIEYNPVDTICLVINQYDSSGKLYNSIKNHDCSWEY
jgi:hypothetical protein